MYVSPFCLLFYFGSYMYLSPFCLLFYFLANFVIFLFFLLFSVTAQYYRHKRLLPSIQYLSVYVCVCLSVVPSIENREWGRRIIIVTEENQGLKGIGLQEMDRVVDPFDRQPTHPSVITLLWYICFSFKLKTKQKTVQIMSRSRK